MRLPVGDAVFSITANIEVQEKIVNPKILVICPIIEMTNKTILYPDFIDGIPITYCNWCED